MRAMDRLVTEYEATQDGELRAVAGAAWRLEPARGERDLHRRLARLVEANPAAIARAASQYGPLRLGAELARRAPDGAWDEMGAVLGQVALPGWSDAVEWLDRGCRGPMPAEAAKALPILRALAATPAPVRRYIDLLFHDADPAARHALANEIEAQGAFDAAALQSALADAIMQMALSGDSDPTEAPSPCADEALAWAIRRFAGIQSMLAGQETPPAGIDTHGAVFTAVTTMSDALAPLEQVEGATPEVIRLVRALRSETLDGWRLAAAELAAWVEAIELRKRADLGALTSADPATLRRLQAALLDNVQAGTEGASTPGELEALLRPRLRLRLERKLQQGGAWPYPADRPAGTYWRALWAAWEEFTDERPPQRCQEAGCTATFPAHGNRRYCDRHQNQRDLERKRRGRTAP